MRGAPQAFSSAEQPTRPSAEAPKPPPAARPAAPREDPGGLSERRVQELYSRYVDAKQRCNESTSSITTETLGKSLRDSAAKLREKHKGKTVDFDVVIKDGRAVLKPVVKG